MEKPVVVRFAPSPTGYLHIGGARTAIFNWLFARKTGGKFILRIEDTDAERSTEDSIRGILDGMAWLGLDWDAGPYFQSRFLRDHTRAALRLLESGHAYRCFCTKAELENKRAAARENKTGFRYDGTCRRLSPREAAAREADGVPFTLRLKVPDTGGSVAFKDEVYGAIEKRYADLEDFVIVRSNGQPLYVLSNAVDDIRDGITHVIRGQDHLANTPKQVLIYRALGEPIPKFAHMSLTLDPDKAKISKRRHGEKVAVHYYREHGFLPWAMVNFLVLLGWSTSDTREIFSREELIAAFSLGGINRTNSVFNVRKDDPKFFTDPKALSINAHYLKSLPVDDLAAFVKPVLETAGIWDAAYAGEKRDWFVSTVDLIRERFQTLTDFATLGRAYFSDHFDVDPEALERHLTRQSALKPVLVDLGERIEGMQTWEAAPLEGILRELLKASGIKTGVLINGIRVAVTGQAVGPEFLQTLLAVGRKRVVSRLKTAAERLA